MTIGLCVSFRLQRNGNSPYLRFDIYKNLPPSCVGFVEFQEGIDDTGELWVFHSRSVNINTVVLHAALPDMTRTCLFCSIPAPKFAVVDITKYLLVGVGYSVPEKFNKVQAGLETVF